MLQYRRGQKQRETLIKVPIYDLGLGHSTRPDPNRLRPGHSVRTFDVNLDRPSSIVQRKVLTPNDFASLAELEARLLAFQQHYQQLAKPFQWRFTRQDLANLLEKLALAA